MRKLTDNKDSRLGFANVTYLILPKFRNRFPKVFPPSVFANRKKISPHKGTLGLYSDKILSQNLHKIIRFLY